MKIKLKEIAEIQTGVYAQTVKDGEVVYLKANHFDENGKLQQVLHPDLMFGKAINKHLLKPGDVLFAAKGYKNYAAWYESKNQPAVASTSFFVIRLGETLSNKILPAYLAWFINSPLAQSFLRARALGTSIASIGKSVLEELEFFVPGIEVQRVILEINQLREKEKQLKNKIEDLREKQIQQQLLNGIQ